MSRAKNEGIKNEIFVQKSHHAYYRNSQYGAQDVFAQFGDVIEKRHFAAFVLLTLDFVLLVEWHKLEIKNRRLI